MRKYNLPIFIPHRGCPHDCVFCNQRKITGIDTDVTADDVRQMIEKFLATTESGNSSTEVAFFGGSFTALTLSTQESLLKAAATFYPRIDGIRLSTRPDCINSEVIALLKKYGVTTVELGVQSSCDEVLAANGRDHSFSAVVDASEQIKAAGIALGHQMMLGMYKSTPEKDIQTALDIAALKPSCVRIYPVVTIKGTGLERLYEDGHYKPYTVMQAASLAKKAVEIFRENSIEVIRIGLHSSEELESEGNVIAGPYHPAFGEIVDSLIYREKIEAEINASGQKDVFEFFCKSCDISKAVGHKGMNKDYFKEKYQIRLKVKAKAGEEMC